MTDGQSPSPSFRSCHGKSLYKHHHLTDRFFLSVVFSSSTFAVSIY
jgi:hypothetical protein